MSVSRTGPSAGTRQGAARAVPSGLANIPLVRPSSPLEAISRALMATTTAAGQDPPRTPVPSPSPRARGATPGGFAFWDHSIFRPLREQLKFTPPPGPMDDRLLPLSLRDAWKQACNDILAALFDSASSDDTRIGLLIPLSFLQSATTKYNIVMRAMGQGIEPSTIVADLLAREHGHEIDAPCLDLRLLDELRAAPSGKPSIPINPSDEPLPDFGDSSPSGGNASEAGTLVPNEVSRRPHPTLGSGQPMTTREDPLHATGDRLPRAQETIQQRQAEIPTPRDDPQLKRVWGGGMQPEPRSASGQVPNSGAGIAETDPLGPRARPLEPTGWGTGAAQSHSSDATRADPIWGFTPAEATASAYPVRGAPSMDAFMQLDPLRRAARTALEARQKRMQSDTKGYVRYPHHRLVCT